MPIANNTSIVLNIHEPKKSAVVAQPGLAADVNEVRIWAAADVNEEHTQNIVGALHQLHNMAQTILKDLSGVADPDILHMIIGGGDNDIVINGTPTAAQVRLEIGTYTGAGDRSHFLDRTFKRLIERWLEESK
jgi:hypothetical protein